HAGKWFRDGLRGSIQCWLRTDSLERVNNLLAFCNLLGPDVLANRSTGCAHAPCGGQVKEHVAYLGAVEVEQVIFVVPETVAVQGARKLAHLAPEHGHGPVLNVEVVVFHVWIRGGSQLALGIELRELLAIEQVSVLFDDTVFFRDELLLW